MTTDSPSWLDERLQLALDAGELGIFDWDLVSDHIRWDERTAAMFGYTLAEWDGRIASFIELVHPDDRDGLEAAIAQAVEACGTIRREYRVRPRGRTDARWVSVRGRVLCDERGLAEAMVGVVQDRTEAHDVDERVGRTLEHIDEAFFHLDEAWRFTYLNHRAEQLLQRTRAELLDREVWLEFPAAVGSIFEDHYTAVMRTGEPVTFEAQYGPLGAWFEVRAYRDPSGLAVYFRDVNERRERERRAAIAQAAAERLLDHAPELRGDAGGPVEVANAICAVGRAVFGCERTSVWRINGDTMSLEAQQGGQHLAVGTAVDVDDIMGLRTALRQQRPMYVIDDQLVDSVTERDLMRMIGVRSFIQAPIRLAGEAGTLVFMLSWREVIEEPDAAFLDVVERFARESALAIEQGRRREVQQQAATLNAQLQAGLLPAPRLSRDDVEVATRYRPGERRLMLGGDFYDCIELADGSVALLIGDVTGHGPEAAAIGSTLRAAWRALALQDMDPAEKVAALDEVLRVERVTDEQMVSVCCCVLAPDLSAATITTAGHPPPILATGDRTHLLEVPSGLLLGAPVVEAPTATTVALPEQFALLLYTDGLPEARLAAGERLGLEAFTQVVAGGEPLAVDSGDSGQEVLVDIHRTVLDRASMPIEDDVALVLLRRRA